MKILKKLGYYIAYPFLFVGVMLDIAYLKWEGKQYRKKDAK